jgi:hypothetical protein
MGVVTAAATSDRVKRRRQFKSCGENILPDIPQMDVPRLVPPSTAWLCNEFLLLAKLALLECHWAEMAQCGMLLGGNIVHDVVFGAERCRGGLRTIVSCDELCAL